MSKYNTRQDERESNNDSLPDSVIRHLVNNKTQENKSIITILFIQYVPITILLITLYLIFR